MAQLRRIDPSGRVFTSYHIFLLAFILLGLNILFNLYNQHILGLGYPFNTFLFIPEDRFADFFKVMDTLHVVETWEQANPYDGIFNAYALPLFTMYYYFFAQCVLLLQNKFAVYILLNVTLIATHFYIARKKGSSFIVIVLSLLSYPVIVNIDRGNYSFMVYILVLISLYSRNVYFSSIALALAASLKLTPVAFLIPIALMTGFSVKRIILAVVVFGSSFLLMNYLSIIFISTHVTDQPFSFSEFVKLVNLYYQEDLTTMRGLAYGSSLYLPTLYISRMLGFMTFYFEFVKPAMLPIIIFVTIGLTLLYKHKYPSPLRLALIVIAMIAETIIIFIFFRSLFLALLIAAISLRGIFFFLKSNNQFDLDYLWKIFNPYLTFEKLVFLASFSFILFMPVTGDYYLLMAFIPLVLFPKNRYSLGYFVAYGILLGAKNIVFLDNTNISLQSFINPLMILLMLIAEFDLIPFIRRTTTDPENLPAGTYPTN